MNQSQNLPQHNYKFYPTLLDAYQWYLKSEREDAARELIDKINRVEITDGEALKRMAKGTAINNLVDAALKTDPRFITSEKFINETVDGLMFVFNIDLIFEIAQRLTNAAQQVYLTADLKVNGANVQLYGYADYIREDRCIDLKFTSAYELGKYKDSMQKHLYPVVLSLNDIPVNTFEFLVTDFENVYSEVYPVDIIESTASVVHACDGLINFIESNRNLITDKKIFGGENDNTRNS